MRIVNRILGLLIAAALGTLAVLVIIEVVAFYTNNGTPALIDYRPWLQWADQTSWSEKAIAIGGIIAAVIGLIWLFFELKPARMSAAKAESVTPGVETFYTRGGVENAVRSAVDRVDGVQRVRAKAKRRKVTVSATAGAREASAANELRPAVTKAAQERINSLQLLKTPKVKVRMLTARK